MAGLPAAASHEAVLALIDAADQAEAQVRRRCLPFGGRFLQREQGAQGREGRSDVRVRIYDIVHGRASRGREEDGGQEHRDGEQHHLHPVLSVRLRAGAVCSVSDVTPWHPTEGSWISIRT